MSGMLVRRSVGFMTMKPSLGSASLRRVEDMKLLPLLVLGRSTAVAAAHHDVFAPARFLCSVAGDAISNRSSSISSNALHQGLKSPSSRGKNIIASKMYTIDLPFSQRFFSAQAATNDDMNKQQQTEEEEEVNPPGWELIHSPPTKGRYPRGSLVGEVVSDKMDKTVNVAVDRYKIIPKYRKRVKFTRKFMAHDEEEECNMGDMVLIKPGRRRSKMKHFEVLEIIRKKPQL